MNIFLLSRDVEKCAQYHCDKHVVKMILEYAQLLSTAHHVLSDKPPEGIYKATHVNHPCAVWARQSNNNYLWLWCLLSYLCDEYEHRYGKVHKTKRLLVTLYQLPEHIPIGHKTSLPQCVADDCLSLDAVAAYRKYYRKHKAYMCTWTKRDQPDWFCKETKDERMD
jgi:hypothetical protein